MATLPSKVLTVGELSQLLTAAFANPGFRNLWVSGEIRNKTVRNGHIYLELSDPNDTSLRRATIRGIIWASVAPRLTAKYEIGDVITCRGRLDYYKGTGSVSLIIDALTGAQAKEGQALLLKRQVLAKLESMGALTEERKRLIPRYVKKLAIVSSREAAGFHDIETTLLNHYPTDECRLFPATVQGARAPVSLVKALRKAYAWHPDCLIIGRGGGSKIDLSCFDDESVALAILDAPCPVITAIGHQIDVSIVDRLADKCAITPTAAAALINPSLDELAADCRVDAKALLLHLQKGLTRQELFMADYQNRLTALMPVKHLQHMTLNLNEYRSKLKALIAAAFTKGQARYERYRNVLKVSTVTKVLARGYALVSKKGVTVTSIKAVKLNDDLDLTFIDGQAQVKVNHLAKKEL